MVLNKIKIPYSNSLLVVEISLLSMKVIGSEKLDCSYQKLLIYKLISVESDGIGSTG